MIRQLIAAVVIVGCAGLVMAQESQPPDLTAPIAAISPPAAPTGVKAVDKKNDHGHAVDVSWTLSSDDQRGARSVISYEIYRWYPALMDSVNNIRLWVHGAIDTIGILNRAERRLNAIAGDLTGDSARIAQDSLAMCRKLVPELRASSMKFADDLEIIAERLPEAHRAYPNNGAWRLVGSVPSGTSRYANQGSRELDASDYIPDFCDFYYRVDAVTIDVVVRSSSDLAGPVQSRGQWFNTGRSAVLIAVLFFAVLTVVFVQKAKRGHDLYVRPLAGIEAVDDAIGRATEMGKPILYLMGAGTAADIATLASFTILARVSKKVAEYQTSLIVPCYDPIVMSIAQDIVKTGYMDAGRPDAYRDDSVFFITQSQFAYVAAVNGIMLRDLPATNLYMGKFYAESLIFAETGALAGSIQIAGTDEVAQIPFFVVACDYTLIGEELFAASAYLGREPLLLGTLKAQDYAKAAILVLAIIGIIAVNLGQSEGLSWLLKFKEVFRVVD
jgi:hypothetical protein